MARKNKWKVYRVRTTYPRASGRRVFIVCRGYRDALKIQKLWGGRIV